MNSKKPAHLSYYNFFSLSFILWSSSYWIQFSSSPIVSQQPEYSEAEGEEEQEKFIYEDITFFFILSSVNTICYLLPTSATSHSSGTECYHRS